MLDGFRFLLTKGAAGKVSSAEAIKFHISENNTI